MNIPITDPAMLLSVVNMKLRDSGETLEDVCAQMGTTRTEVETILSSAGFSYDEAHRRFW
ncbi:MAG: DUF4250 domain-containing protein [Bacteroidaceae bacterium]|nr:DUF4250 domain-containing protein [Bacteroidaceae bacterium]